MDQATCTKVTYSIAVRLEGGHDILDRPLDQNASHQAEALAVGLFRKSLVKGRQHKANDTRQLSYIVRNRVRRTCAPRPPAQTLRFCLLMSAAHSGSDCTAAEFLASHAGDETANRASIPRLRTLCRLVQLLTFCVRRRSKRCAWARDCSAHGPANRTKRMENRAAGGD